MSTQAEAQLPVGLQKIIEYNNQSTQDFAVKASFALAFLAGILGILSPCILPFLPAYFSYTFKEKRNVTAMTIVFFLGFSIVFVAMGILSGFLGERSLVAVQKGWLVIPAGILLVTMGLLALTDRGFSSFVKLNYVPSNDVLGTFLFGVAFAIGWTACLGPILVGILGIGALLHEPITSGFLLFFYSLGNLVPLFILALLYDKFHLEKLPIIKGKELEFSWGTTKYRIHTTNLIAGLLFIGIGLFLIIFKNTAPVNSYDVFGTREYFYSIQDNLLQWEYATLAGVVCLATFIFILAVFFIKRYKGRKA